MFFYDCGTSGPSDGAKCSDYPPELSFSTLPPAIAIAGNISFTINYTICNDYTGNQMWLAVYPPNGNYEYETWDIPDNPLVHSNYTFTHYFSQNGKYTIWAAMGGSKPYGIVHSETYTVEITGGTAGNIVSIARSYLSTCTAWFIPPQAVVFGGDDGTQKNNSGAYPWADNGLLNNGSEQETVLSCRNKLYYATPQNQTSWNDYLNSMSDPRAGWPGGVDPNPSIEHKAGFICYVFVAQVLKEAGYNIYPDNILTTDWYANNYPVVTGIVKPGDLVLYDFDRNGSYDHVGIITDASATNQDQYMVISSIGLVENFSYGIAEKRLGIFGSIDQGGGFTSWNPEWEPINKLIVRP